MQHKYNTFNNNKYESHRLVFDLIKARTDVLELGCATGYFAKKLKEKGCSITGIDYDKSALSRAKKYYDKVFVCDFNLAKRLPLERHKYDYVLAMDVIEHLQCPERFLQLIKQNLKKNGKLIVSVPNIAHASIRWMIIKGDFRYEKTGILDETHLRFFTKDSIKNTLESTGYRVERLIPTNGMCKVPLLYKITDRLPGFVQYKIACLAPELFAFQFIALVSPN